MKAKYLLILLSGIVVNVFAQSTSDLLNQQASIPVASPNVAALNKFVEFPVNHFNGQANVSFPLYEIQLKSVSIPITLKYHTGGIRVGEEASWVGLGWALDAGGVISHQVNGKDDVADNNYYSAYGAYLPFPTKEQNETYTDGTMFHTVTLRHGGILYDKDLQQVNNAGAYFNSNYDKIDGEPDLYLYSMGNYSGKFIHYDNTLVNDFSRNKECIDLSCNNMLFTQHIGNAVKGDSIIAVDPNGNIYRFMDKDIETSISAAGMGSGNPKTSISAYHLSEIISPGGERIVFHYKTFKQLITENGWESQFPGFSNSPDLELNGYYPSVPTLFEECYFIEKYAPNHPWRSEFIRLISNTFSKALYLEKIEFPSGTIEFIKSPREDTYGLKLDKVQVKNNAGVKIKTFEFKYGYFVADNSGTGTDASTATNVRESYRINYPVDYLRKRLKLISFSEKNNSETISEPYSFTYAEGLNEKLPFKSSFAQDFWGYYNGRLNTTLLPSYEKHDPSLNISPAFGKGQLASWVTADRTVYPSHAKAGILTGITHPTSGKTTFEYESNECITNLISSEHIENRWINAIDYNETAGWGRAEFTLTEKTKVSIQAVLGCKTTVGGMSVNYYTEPYGNGQTDDYLKKNYFYAVIEKKVENPNWNHYGKFIVFDAKYVWNASDVLKNTTWYESAADASFSNIEFEPGTYRLTACFPDERGNYITGNGEGSIGSSFVSLSVTYDELIPAGTREGNYLTGGLRIKKVIQTDPSFGSPAIEKQYTYKQGILATSPAFIFRHMMPNPDWDSDDYVTYMPKVSLSPNPIYPNSFSANGNLIGYRNITETYSDGGEIGKIEYTYRMDGDISNSALPIPATPKLTNGFLVSKMVYDKDERPVSKNTYTPELLNTKVYWGFKLDPFVSYPSDWYVSSLFDSWTSVYFYPIVQGRVVTRKEEEATGLDSLGSELRNSPFAFRKNTNYTYNHYGQVIEKKTYPSTGGTLTETYKYVPLASGEVYRLMQEKNIISPLIETQTSNSGAFTRQVTNYFQPHPGVFVPSHLQLGSGTESNPAVETRIAFDNRYDKFGNPNSITKDNAGSVIYLWSYKGAYPVAEIRNADYETVNTALGTVGLGSVETLSANAAPDKTKLDNLRNVTSLSGAHITTYKYEPLIGIIEATAPNGVTTYYKYDSFNRLQTIVDHDGNVVESYEYHLGN